MERQRAGGAQNKAARPVRGHWAAILAAIAGYMDALAYLTMHAFVANMTGTTVLLGIALAEGQWTQAARAGSTVLCFFGGILAARLMLRLGARPGLPLLAAAALLAAASVLLPHVGLPLLAGAMGLQNAAMTRFGMATINTAFITGDLQRLGQAIVDPSSSSSRPVILLIILVWSAYVGGAALGAIAPHSLEVLPLHANAALLVGAAIIGLLATIL